MKAHDLSGALSSREAIKRPGDGTYAREHDEECNSVDDREPTDPVRPVNRVITLPEKCNRDCNKSEYDEYPVAEIPVLSVGCRRDGVRQGRAHEGGSSWWLPSVHVCGVSRGSPRNGATSSTLPVSASSLVTPALVADREADRTKEGTSDERDEDNRSAGRERTGDTGPRDPRDSNDHGAGDGRKTPHAHHGRSA